MVIPVCHILKKEYRFEVWYCKYLKRMSFIAHTMFNMDVSSFIAHPVFNMDVSSYLSFYYYN